MRNRRIAVVLAVTLSMTLTSLSSSFGLAAGGPAHAAAQRRPAAPVSDEFPVSPPRWRPAPGFQATPAIASNGDLSLVVWQDARFGDEMIFAARVGANGRVLDPAGFPITDAESSGPGAPAVAWNGSVFLVVWHDFRNVTGTDPTDSDIYGARVTPAGRVLDPDGFRIAGAADELNPAIAANGPMFFVAWERYERFRSGPRVFGSRVSGAGTVLDPSGIDIASRGSFDGDPAVSAFGAGFVAVWIGDDVAAGTIDVLGARIDAHGAVLDAAPIPIATGPNQQIEPAVASTGTALLVVWSEYRADTATNGVYGARLGPGGTVLEPGPFRISDATSSQGEPDLAAAGDHFVVVWDDFRAGGDPDVYGARVTAGGAVVDPAGFAISTAPNGQYSPVVAAGATSAFVVWQDARFSNDYDVFGARVADGSVVDPAGRLVSRSAAAQVGAAIAANRSRYFVAWTESDGRTSDVLGARITRDGASLDGTGIRIATGPGNQFTPSVAWNGHVFFVVWEEDAVIRGARVARDGRVLDRPALTVSPPPSPGDCCDDVSRAQRPDVAWTGRNFLVVWTHIVRRSPYTGRVEAARVTSRGAVLDRDGVVLSQGTDASIGAAAASTSASAVVVWEEQGAIHGAVVDPRGAPLPAHRFAMPAASPAQGEPDVATDGTDFAVVWSDFTTGDGDIRAARVTAGGTVTTPLGVPVVRAPGDQTQPAIAFAGDYLVAWRDERNGRDGDIRATAVDARDLHPTGEFPVFATANAARSPAVAAGPGGAFGVAYDRDVTDPAFQTSRVFLRTVAPK